MAWNVQANVCGVGAAPPKQAVKLVMYLYAAICALYNAYESPMAWAPNNSMHIAPYATFNLD